jgi:hypothetical protein
MASVTYTGTRVTRPAIALTWTLVMATGCFGCLVHLVVHDCNLVVNKLESRDGNGYLKPEYPTDITR